MTKGDFKRFAVVMGTFSMAFGLEISREKIGVFLSALEDLSIEALEFAGEQIIRQEAYFPPPAKVREYANQYRQPLVQDLHRTAIPEGFKTDEVALARLAELKAMLGIGQFVFEDGGTC